MTDTEATALRAMVRDLQRRLTDAADRENALRVEAANLKRELGARSAGVDRDIARLARELQLECSGYGHGV